MLGRKRFCRINSDAWDHCDGLSWLEQCCYWPVLADLQEELELGQLTVIPSLCPPAASSRIFAPPREDYQNGFLRARLCLFVVSHVKLSRLHLFSISYAIFCDPSWVARMMRGRWWE